jgi:hypothetical protein
MPLDRAAPARPSTTEGALDRGERGRALRCRACSRVVTWDGARVEVGGAHAHTFCNPHGHVFGIGCFAVAPGCTQVGPATDFFSWFPGYAWRMSVCAGCGTHLGWSYGERPDFWGLVLAQLIEGDDDQG